jgi:adenylate kinase
VYAILSTFIKNPGFKNSTPAKIVLSVIPEMIVVLVLAVIGIQTRNIKSLRKLTKVESALSGPEA